ncbi:MAG: hypothetical protein LUH18_01095 [Oscillospiraceae bacterium]|nr:hypothetical protein [Oscillospiraceae bacterium]
MNLEDVDVFAEGFAEVFCKGEDSGQLEEASSEYEKVEVAVLRGFSSGIGTKEIYLFNAVFFRNRLDNLCDFLQT